ncbi:hypothetical protein D3C87_2076190 [compost metagenome]
MPKRRKPISSRGLWTRCWPSRKWNGFPCWLRRRIFLRRLRLKLALAPVLVLVQVQVQVKVQVSPQMPFL